MKQINKDYLSATALHHWRDCWISSKTGKTLPELYIEEAMTGRRLWAALRTSPLRDEEEGRISYSKQQLQHSLLTEQGYICCYCNRDITATTMDIEHFKPKGVRENFSLVYEYSNLLGSCDGFKKEPKTKGEVCCNAKRLEKEELPLSPLSKDIEEHFDFTIDGQISGKSLQGKEMVEKLNLSLDRLNDLRGKAIRVYLYETPPVSLEFTDLDTDFSDGMFSDYPVLVSKSQAIEYCKQLQDKQNGKYKPFCTAIIKVLQSEIVDKGNKKESKNGE